LCLLHLRLHLLQARHHVSAGATAAALRTRPRHIAFAFCHVFPL
jgi:hypothetical protein